MITAEFKTYGVISLIFCGIFVLALPLLIGLLVEQIVQWDSQPFTRSVNRSKLYDFTEFDGYLDTVATSKAGTYEVVYLIKNQKAERIITGFYFSNIDELRAALSPIKYLGFREDFSRLARKALLRKPLID
jgi:hypothetical protein